MDLNDIKDKAENVYGGENTTEYKEFEDKFKPGANKKNFIPCDWYHFTICANIENGGLSTTILSDI